MNIIKTLLGLALLTLLLGCSEANDDNDIDLTEEFAISEIFGIKIGTVDEDLPPGYAIENKEITFTANKTDKRFVKYEYSTTPKSHIIYGIKTKSPLELAKKDCLAQQDALIKQTLNALGDTSEFRITQENNKWKIRESNQREITIECERSTSPEQLQLVMTYQDTALSLLAFREWRKRQKEITLIRF
ncbi:MAG TPA: hypothetical protein EYG50_08290 [Cycloclasticus sp.]|jgi:hypothetical protein|nr:hypothetical protein [Cycloclasticus sp.]HIL92721.1 hypothetical protein [Cycloclasticus sp.]